jgi:hypothetical protein
VSDAGTDKGRDDAPARVRLADLPDETRSTTTLVASLGARISMLTLISGSSAVGSLMAGFAALGRRVSRTAEGARMRRALEAGRAGHNVAALWKALRIDHWASGVAPTPVLDHLRNDLAILLAGDLDETLALLPVPGHPAGAGAEADDDSVSPLDCLVGMWFYSTEMVRGIEALAAPTLPLPGSVVAPNRDGREPEGSLLR